MKKTKDNRLVKPIVFIGTGRSGSTLISGAIFSHRKIGYPSNYQNKFPGSLSVNFIRHLFDNKLWRIYTRGNKSSLYHKSLFLPSESYNMWRYLTDEDTDFSRDFLHNKRAKIDEIKRIRNYFNKMLILQNKHRLAFKLTGPSRISYIQSIFPDAQFVWVKRRIIPTVSSFMKKDFWQIRGKYKLWFRGVYSKGELQYFKTLNDHPAEITAFQLGKIISVTYKEIDNYQPSLLDIQYEDFLKSPEENISNILDFLHLDKDKACFDYVIQNKLTNKLKLDTEYYDSESLDYIYKAYNSGLKET